MITPERENYNIVIDELNETIDLFIGFHWDIPVDELDEIDDKRQFFCDILKEQFFCNMMSPTAYLIDSARYEQSSNNLDDFSFFYSYFYCDADLLNPKYVRNNCRDNNLYRYWSIDENDHMINYQA